METLHDIQNGLPVITTTQEALLQQWLGTTKKVKAKWTKSRPQKTHQQVKCHWGLVMMYAKKAFDEAGYEVLKVPLCKEQVLKVLYSFCGGVGENGEHKTMSEMDIEEMSLFFDNCRTFLAQMNVVVPEPDVDWRQK